MTLAKTDCIEYLEQYISTSCVTLNTHHFCLAQLFIGYRTNFALDLNNFLLSVHFVVLKGSLVA